MVELNQKFNKEKTGFGQSIGANDGRVAKGKRTIGGNFHTCKLETIAEDSCRVKVHEPTIAMHTWKKSKHKK